MTFGTEEMAGYLAYLEDHGRRPETIRTYRQYITRCLTILDEGGRPTVSADIMDTDIIWLRERLAGLKEGTVVRYLFILGQMVEHTTGRNPYDKADLMWNRETPERVFITMEQFGELYRAADQQTRVILVLGAFMGLRRGEIADVRERDIDGRMLTVRGKGHGPEGLVTRLPIPDEVAVEIGRLREWKRSLGLPSEDDFLLQRRDGGVLRQHGKGYITVTIQRLGQRCGIHVTPHSLRRLYATVLFNRADADLNTLRILMRHASVSTTLTCYVNADPEKIQRARACACATLGAVLEV